MLRRLRAPAALTGGGDPMGPAGPGAPGAPQGSGEPGGPSGGGMVGVVGTKGHVPSLPIQVNALQALCRQLFGFRLAMTALAAPFALTSAETGLGAWLVGSAVLVTFMLSYVLMRDWERFGPVLLRHPSLLAADMLFGALLLFTASPNSPLGIVTICTPLLAGLVYSWRGAGIFAALQIVLLAAAYAVTDLNSHTSGLLLVGLCVLAGAVGGTLRGLLLRFGAASQALTETRARLAVNEAVEGERARLAREMHDSVAKTLHGLALAADGLASSADRMDPATVKHQAELVARSARRAASEARELLSDLRRASGADARVDLAAELAERAADFSRRSGIRTGFLPLAGAPLPPLPPAVARHLLTIASEAMENAHRHAAAGHVDVRAGIVGDQLCMSVQDDGRGLPPDTTLAGLKRAGHFGLVGMVERAAGIGARIRIGKGHRTSGTEVRVDLPLAALPAAAGEGAEAAGPGGLGLGVGVGVEGRGVSAPSGFAAPAGGSTPAGVQGPAGVPGPGGVAASAPVPSPVPAATSFPATGAASVPGTGPALVPVAVPPPAGRPFPAAPLPLPGVPGFPLAEPPGPARDPDPSTLPLAVPRPGRPGARPAAVTGPVAPEGPAPRELPALWQPPASQELPALREPSVSRELPPLQEPPAAAPPYTSQPTPPPTP
ncbi:hypothetical protein Sm713_09630 [Streptomyces sp. TS71-3]|nr:hypothetical protein Sm713_09630 [Streptomyces sp. TS71-3]